MLLFRANKPFRFSYNLFSNLVEAVTNQNQFFSWIEVALQPQILTNLEYFLIIFYLFFTNCFLSILSFSKFIKLILQQSKYLIFAQLSIFKPLGDPNQYFLRVSYVSSILDPTTHLTSYISIFLFFLILIKELLKKIFLIFFTFKK